MPHLSGKKVGSKHSTVIDEIYKLLVYLNKTDIVSKIVPGEIKVIRQGPKRIKLKEISAGWELMVRGINVRQKVYIYTQDKYLIKKVIENFFNNK